MPRRRSLPFVVLAAFALPAAVALLASGSCSLVGLYDGAADGSADAAGGGSSVTGASSGAGGRDGGSATDGGDEAGDAGDGDAAPTPSPCPSDMVKLTITVDGGYCIDRLEVTNLAYADFLTHVDAGGPQEPPGRCDWNTSYQPAVVVSVDAGGSLPVLGVDWCDAYAYCRWAGKRLCGAVGGGPIDPALRDIDNSQWFRACSHSDGYVYPYGDGFSITACADCNPGTGCDVDASPPSSEPAPVGTKKGCSGGYSGLFDMSGNAAEWEDDCGDAGVRPDASDDAGHPIPDPRYDVCYHRGGSFYLHGDTEGQACLACSTAGCGEAADDRYHRPHDVGLRCCLDY